MLDLCHLEDAALAFANELRGRAGAPPVETLLPGRTVDSCFCPIARTAGLGWLLYDWVAYRWVKGVLVDAKVVDPPAAQFVRRFDAGAFPHLIARDPERPVLLLTA